MVPTAANALEFLQNRFDEAYRETEGISKGRVSEAERRRWTAYALKGVAVFGGIAVAAGLPGVWPHVVGILIAVAVAADSISSNHKRVLVVTKAANAYASLLRNVRYSYNQKLPAILQLSQADPAKAQQELEKHISVLMDKLHNDSEAIESALREEDLKLLNALSLEQGKGEKVGP